ncbi:AAA family ATPase [Aquisphaera insulae]|uniref:AAA family ATPase n=1 Tax=Aquisphaera insulae TaxID=2712864 RepID=UPI0013EB4692|nr:AAA family ATPase [Aquisphaera insulae]
MPRHGFLKSIRLDGFLSFPPGSAPIDLEPLNVIIGPNGGGKSNLIEAIELLHAAPTAFANAIRDGGGPREWLWKGDPTPQSAEIDVVIHTDRFISDLRHQLSFAASGARTEILNEAIEEPNPRYDNQVDVFFYYRYQEGRPALNVRTTEGKQERRALRREDLKPDESVLSQRKDPESYPEVTWLGEQYRLIQIFREWSIGRHVSLRQPQPADLPSSPLLADSRNLGLLLNEIEHSNAGAEFNRLLALFMPRYAHFSTRVQGGTVQFYLHEKGLKAPIPATRLSDGTIRFMAILALLLDPSPPPLTCIEEPELGLHPDAVSILADLFMEASERTQLIVTTHSDELISGLSDQPQAVLTCEYRNGTVLERVDPESLASWLEKYRLGELWRIGELGGNP